MFWGDRVGGLSTVGFVDVDGGSDGASLGWGNRASVTKNSTSRDLVVPVRSIVPIPITIRLCDGFMKNCSGTTVVILRLRRPDFMKEVEVPYIGSSMLMIGRLGTPCWVRTTIILPFLRMNPTGWDKRHSAISRELGDTGFSIHVSLSSH
jgi:hypothetical protein